MGTLCWGTGGTTASVAIKVAKRASENLFNWTGPKAIAKEFGLRDRTAIYRHAHALRRFSKRQRNVRAALEKIIERAGEVDITAAGCHATKQGDAPDGCTSFRQLTPPRFNAPIATV